MEIYTKSANETISLGKKVGELVSPGDVVLLDGDLGAGKTTLTKGIGEALGVFRTINSPTFTIMKMYEGKYPLYHMDLYRLNGSGMDFDLEEYIFGDGVAVIEWPHQAFDLLPDEYLLVEIFRASDEGRKIVISAKGNRYNQIMEALL